MERKMIDYMEKEHNVLIEETGKMFRVGGSYDDETGWQPIPSEWVKDAKKKLKKENASKLRLKLRNDLVFKIAQNAKDIKEAVHIAEEAGFSVGAGMNIWIHDLGKR